MYFGWFGAMQRSHNGTVTLQPCPGCSVGFRSCVFVSAGPQTPDNFTGTLHQTPDRSPRSSGCCRFVVPSSQRCFNCPFMSLPWHSFPAPRYANGLFSILTKSRAPVLRRDDVQVTADVFCVSFCLSSMNPYRDTLAMPPCWSYSFVM